MKDLLENYVVISTDCCGYFIYTEFYPKVHPSFIHYNTPLISTLMVNQFHFIKLCERYDELMAIPPTIVPCPNKDRKEREVLLEDIRIMLTHENEYPHIVAGSQDNASAAKWNARIALGKGKTKIYVWAPTEMLIPCSMPERIDVLERFKKLDGYSFFITDVPEEEYEDDQHVVKCVSNLREIWDSRPTSGNVHLKNTLGIVPIFKEMIENKVP